MQDINEIQPQIDETEQLQSLESLIIEGEELRIPITFNFPTKTGIVKASAIIRPLTASEWETAQNYVIQNKKGFILKILEKGLLNDNEEPLSPQLIQKLPFGVAHEIYLRIADISGIKENKEEQYELTKELLGF